MDARSSRTLIRRADRAPLVMRTSVRYDPAMHAEQLDHLAARHAVFTTTVMYMQHPRNDYVRWRHDWAEVNRLVEEINRMVELQPRPK